MIMVRNTVRVIIRIAIPIMFWVNVKSVVRVWVKVNSRFRVKARD